MTSRSALLATTMLAALYAPAAIAQDNEPSDDEASIQETIYVIAPDFVPTEGGTANKSDIALIETPQSVSVITRDQIDLLNFIDAQQAVRYTSGVFGENYGPDLRFDFITARGFTPKQYIDGLAAPVSTSIFSIGLDLYAFESFDILKGPASALYGNSPPGGLYNQTSRRPEREFGGELSAKYGTDDYKQIAGTFTGPLGDNLSFRLTGLYRDRNAERDKVSSERKLFAPALTWNITSDTELTLLGYYQSDEVLGDTNGFLPVQGTLLPNPVGEIDPGTNLGHPANRYDREQWGLGYEFVHAFNESVKFVSNTKLSGYEEATPTGIYGSGGLINTTDPSQPSYFRTVLQSNFTYRETVDSIATDNRFDIDLETGALTHDIIAGYDFREVENDADFGFFFGTDTIDLFNPDYDYAGEFAPGYPSSFNDQTLQHSGFYVQDHIGVGEHLFFTLSGRYDDVTIENNATGAETQQDAFTYRVGANYVFDSGIAPYVSYATSFEPVLGSDSVTGNDFEPSEGEQVEAGIKYDARGLPEGYELLLTGAVYQIKQTNVVSTAPSVTPVFGTQTGEVEVEGAEIELVSRIDDRLSINASYSYTDSEVVDSSTPAEIGEPLPVTPENKASLFVDYSFIDGPLAGFGIGGGVRYTGESQGALPGPFTPVVYTGEESTLVDAIIRYDTGQWRFAINGSNILDEQYVARCAGPAGCTYGAGRQVIATVTRKF
ncbi:TonB-dependent siderophore receptor [Henriciella sp.]|uniref:TonB-dependent siderophore receptor n=1 Tax=Henriciella sp. TaxID=1968823 RepID=UPI002604DA60|nr:TonB-dependent siderophore receptor [Henriciella sp.]